MTVPVSTLIGIPLTQHEPATPKAAMPSPRAKHSMFPRSPHVFAFTIRSAVSAEMEGTPKHCMTVLETTFAAQSRCAVGAMGPMPLEDALPKIPG